MLKDVFVRHYDIQITFDGDELFEAEECCRIAVTLNLANRFVLEGPESPTSLTSTQNQLDEQAPPVESGDVREATIESLGDQGNGIAKVEQEYVVIVPAARPGDEVTVEIENARESVSFAEICDSEPTTTTS